MDGIALLASLLGFVFYVRPRTRCLLIARASCGGVALWTPAVGRMMPLARRTARRDECAGAQAAPRKADGRVGLHWVITALQRHREIPRNVARSVEQRVGVPGFLLLSQRAPFNHRNGNPCRAGSPADGLCDTAAVGVVGLGSPPRFWSSPTYSSHSWHPCIKSLLYLFSGGMARSLGSDWFRLCV